MRAAPLALAAIATAATPARADEHGQTQVIAADAASDTLMLVLFTPMSEEASGVVFAIGLASQLLAPPIIHAAANDWNRAGIDLGARIVAPALGILIATGLCDDHPKHNEWLPCLGPQFAGGIVGVLGAQILDWLVISRPTDGIAARTISFGARF